jgi:putative colanic acid biosynthesis acetyltransferase WcaF
MQDLATFDNSGFDRGAGLIKRLLWQMASVLVFEPPGPGAYAVKRAVLRLFGARVGRGVVVKPRVRIKFPWRLRVGDHSWIGEDAWLDNLAEVELGANVCVSQGAYLCTGSHDRRKPTFDLITKPIRVEDGAWVGARALLLGGVVIGKGAVVGAGSVVKDAVAPGRLVAGNPAVDVGPRA